MANLVRSAKSARNWSDYELTAYNITISSRSPDEFFPTPDPSLDHIDPAILNSPPDDRNPTLSDDTVGYLRHLALATGTTHPMLFIDDIPARTLELLHFDGPGTLVIPGYAIPLNICGRTSRGADTSACLVYLPTFVLLVVVEDYALTHRTNAQARVVAEAIATFQSNNKRRRELGLDPLDIMNVPCIVMNRTRPTFFVVPVTTELSDAVIAGQYPTARTEVLRCATEAAHVQGTEIGMEDIEYRKLVLRRFLTFKEVAKSHWERVLEGVPVPKLVG
jgi:hypothetical protein